MAKTFPICAFLLFAAAACTGREPSEAIANGPRWRSALTEDTSELDRTLASTFARPRQGHLEVLLLSGGGANGAWGAGVLGGWAESPAGRPQFDVVAGVSTGALLATHTFLGRRVDDEILARNYTEITKDDVLDERFLLWVPFSASFATSDPLADLILRWITDDVIDCVAAEAEKGRVLLAGTVDLDSGSLVVWNLSAIAASGTPERYERYRRVLLASSSFPILLPPILIDGELHGDGALRGRLFVQRVLDALVPDGASLAGVPAEKRPRVHLIINGKAGLPVLAVRERIVDVGKRALNIMLDDNLVGAVDTARRLAHRDGYELRYCRIPETEDLVADPSAFDTDDMRRLYERARAFGRGDPGAGVWDIVSPTLP